MEHALGLSWWKLLLGGFSLWTASVIVTAITGNFNMVPTVLILGSPVASLAFESAQPGDKRPRQAIDEARAWVRGEITMSQARTAAGHANAAAET
jgi:hypothetical protein